MNDVIKEQLIVAGYNTIFVLGLVIALGMILNAFKMKMLEITSKIFGSKIGGFIINRFTFIGVIHHELSHAFMAILCGAQVTEVSVFKFKGDTLGNIKFIPRGPKIFRDLQMCFAALAPSLCGITTLYLLICFVNMKYDFLWWQWAILIYVELSILLHMTLSTVDIKAALKGMITTLVIIFIVLFFTKIDIIVQIIEISKRFVGKIA